MTKRIEIEYELKAEEDDDIQDYKKPWVGLTDEEIEASKPTSSNDAVVWELAVEWAEAKLRSKNNA
jgi:hypothetical protein